MRKMIKMIQTLAIVSLAIPVMAQDAPPPGPGMAMKQYNVDEFVKQVDTDKDGSMSKEEWKDAGLIEMPFAYCDANKDDKLSEKEMADCRLPEAMDLDGDGVLMVGEMIEFDKMMAGAPKKKYEATSPYVEGGETGMDFIRVLDEDGDGKVNHAEWEKNKPSTVYKDKHWPEYNKNMDEFITVDEAPQKP
jgi:Ca2+-binding EF-hand superfamily protein